MRTPVAIAATLLALAAPVALAAEKPPKVGEVDYFKQVGEQGPATRLEVYFRHTPDSVKLRSRFGDERAKATASKYTPVTSHRFGHPWVPDHDNGRRELLNVIKDSIDATGKARLTVVAENDAGRSKTDVEIVFSECHREPPIYPFTCSVEP